MRKAAIYRIATAICALLVCAVAPIASMAQSATDGIVYSNIVSLTVQQQLAGIMMAANITEARRQVFLDHVNRFNSIVETDGLAAEFETLTSEAMYDPYEMQDQWSTKSPDFMGYNCRITAFGLMRDFLEIPANTATREDMIVLDLAALEEDASVLLESGDRQAFSALFSTVPTGYTKDITAHAENLQKDWNDRGIRFHENSGASLICVVFHESIDEQDNYLFIGHAGVLFEQEAKLYFVEKLAFQEPYQLTVFSDRAQLNDYLMTKYDVAFDQPAAAPFVMENDKLMYVTDNESSQMTDEVHLDDFALGITPVQMLSQAGKLNLEIEMPDYDEIPLPSDAADAVEDGRVYNMTDYSFYYKLKDCDTYFTFSPEGKLVGISSRDAAVVFTKVVRIGSSLDDAIAVYGREYVENPEDYSAVQYNTPDGYLDIFHEYGIVTGWSPSAYANINND